ncbi:MAG TPA: DNA repair protein RecN [Myxococcaceae bacterium]|nr:DNA repair protein RecN [Myxococcaceae bacterium]
MKAGDAMLMALRMNNLAVAEQVEVGFGPGLTVLTGETGAGKSILVDALGLLLGGRADPEVVRAGAQEAVVEGVFLRTPALAERLEALGLPDLGEELSVRRVVGKGRNKVHVNGALVTVGVLGQLMRGVVEVAGQHAHVGLLDPTRHLPLLDRFLGEVKERAAYTAAWEALGRIRSRMEALGGDEQQLLQRVEFLRFQLEELERIAPKPGELEALELERRRLMGADRQARHCQEALGLIDQEGAQGPVSRAKLLVAEAVKLDPRLEPVLQGLSTAAAELEEAERALEQALHALEADPERLVAVDDRLDLLKQLCRKHATDCEGLAARTTSLREELTQLEDREAQLAALEVELADALKRAEAAAKALRGVREKGAKCLSDKVQASLASLALERARFEVRVTPRDVLRADGGDQVAFEFSANPGEPLRPLSRVASGGEAARVMLALRACLAGAEETACEVLDEVDSGVSGAVADVVGRLIRELATRRQVLCITHLPQVAAHAEAHLVVKKQVAEGRTFSEVEALEGTAKTQELARMLSGVKVSKEALGAAEALVRAARGTVRSGRRRVPRALAAREVRSP